MKLKCLLIDDEPPALKVLQSHISKVNGLEVVALCSNGVEALELLHEKQVDLIFLDIKMPGITGTELLKSLPHPPRVIFVTAYRDYALDGYELDAVDYLVKPVSFERFLKAIGKVKRQLTPGSMEYAKEFKGNPDAFVYLKVDRTMQKILINEILYIESWNDYVKLYMNKGRDCLVKQPIRSMENLLSSHKFLRVHRSYMVSLSKVTGYNNFAVQLGTKEIPIGRLYKQQVIRLIRSG